MSAPEPHSGHDELLAQLGWMRALARHLTRDAEVADDVLQRACLLALQRPAGVAAEGVGLRAWLAAVLRRVAGHSRREAARSQAREQAAAAPEALPATIDLAARREILQRLVDAVMALDEPAFSTIVRRYYEGRSTLEIAAQDGVSPEVVRQRLARARTRLRDRLTSTLDPRWLPALALLSPRAADVARPVSHRVLRGLLMTERTTRPVVWKAAAAAVVVALGAGAWYALGSGAHDSTSAPVARLPDAPPPAQEAPALPPPLPARVEPVPVQAASVAPPAPAATAEPEPTPAPAVASGAAWDRLWVTTDAMMRGTARFDDVLDTTDVLLGLAQAKLAEDGAETLAEAGSPLVILDEDGVGRATLAVVTYENEGGPPTQGYRFEVKLDTADGRYTGLQQSKDDITSLAISFGLDADGRVSSCGTVVQNMPAQTAELHAHMVGRGPLGVGGVLAVRAETSDWQPLTSEAQTVDPQTGLPLEDASFHFTTGEAEARTDSLANSRVAPLGKRLSALGPGRPRR